MTATASNSVLTLRRNSAGRDGVLSEYTGLWDYLMITKSDIYKRKSVQHDRSDKQEKLSDKRESRKIRAMHVMWKELET